MASMQWANRPDILLRRTMPVLRAKPAMPVQGVILCHDLTGAWLHFSGRSIPHIEPADQCEGCRNSLPRRWEGWFSLWSQTKAATALVCIPPGAAPQFHDAMKLHGSLRGLSVKLQRWSNRPNGRLIAEFAQSGIAATHLPDAPDVPAILSHMWGLDRVNVEHRFHTVETMREIAAAAEQLPLPSAGDELVTTGPVAHTPTPATPPRPLTAREDQHAKFLARTGNTVLVRNYLDELGRVDLLNVYCPPLPGQLLMEPPA
uniref:Uncharacterized protein n=1 Tax=Schlesneria paludicola TaxID=360056 RepID=A0A7C2JZ27_9PLAN